MGSVRLRGLSPDGSRVDRYYKSENIGSATLDVIPWSMEAVEMIISMEPRQVTENLR